MTDPEVIHKLIEKKAYDIWEYRQDNLIDGDALEDWLEGERQVNWQIEHGVFLR